MQPRTSRQPDHHASNEAQWYGDCGFPVHSFSPPLYRVPQPYATVPASSVDDSAAMAPMSNLHFGLPCPAPYGVSEQIHQRDHQPWLSTAPSVAQNFLPQLASSMWHWDTRQGDGSQAPWQNHGQIPLPVRSSTNGIDSTEQGENTRGYSENKTRPHHPHAISFTRNDQNGPSGNPPPQAGRGRLHHRGCGRGVRVRGTSTIGRRPERRTGLHRPGTSECPGNSRGHGRNKRRGRRGAKQGDATTREMILTKSVLERLGASLPGSSPHEIERWVEARKRNWPSRTNVVRKLAEQERHRRAGDLMNSDMSGASRRYFRRPRAPGTASNPVPLGVSRQERVPASTCRPENVPMRTNSQLSGTVDALSHIVAAYGSSTDEECEGTDESALELRESHDITVLKTTPSVRADNRCVEIQINGAKGGVKKTRNQKRNQKRRNRKNKVQAIARHKETRPTRTGLLRKLLDDEVRREQSILLQAFRYLLETDYVSERAEREIQTSVIESTTESVVIPWDEFHE